MSLCGNHKVETAPKHYRYLRFNTKQLILTPINNSTKGTNRALRRSATSTQTRRHRALFRGSVVVLAHRNPKRIAFTPKGCL